MPKRKRQSVAAPVPQMLTLEELLAKTLPPAVPRVAPWLDSGESCLLWGGTGTGKSMLAMTLALGVAGGGEVLGWRFPNPCKVLFVDGEQSPRDLQARFGMLGKSIPGHDARLATKNLQVMGRTLCTPGAAFFDLNGEPKAAEAFVRHLKEQEVGFVVFDNLSTLSDSLMDENKAAEFKKTQSLLSHLKAANIAAVLVHHAGKGKTSYRGSSNIATTFERVLGLVHDDRTSPTVLAATASIEKFRGKAPAEFAPVFNFRFVSEEGAGGSTIKARWEIDEAHGQLAEAWRMFKAEDWDRIEDFVRAVNRKFGRRDLPKNFRRDFVKRWERDLAIPSAEIEKAIRWAKQDRRASTRAGDSALVAGFPDL